MKPTIKQLFLQVIEYIQRYTGPGALRDEFGAIEFLKQHPEQSDSILRSRLRNLASRYPREVMEFLRKHSTEIPDLGIVIMLHEVSCDAITALCNTRAPAANIRAKVRA